MAKGDLGAMPAPQNNPGRAMMGGFNPFAGQNLPRFAMPQRPNLPNQAKPPANGMMMRPPMNVGPSPQVIPGMNNNTGIAGGMRQPRFGQY